MGRGRGGAGAKTPDLLSDKRTRNRTPVLTRKYVLNATHCFGHQGEVLFRAPK